MGKVLEAVRTLATGAWAAVSRKALYVAIAFLFAAAKQRFPELPLPPVDLVVDLTLALIGTHTLMDVVALLGTFVVEYAKAKQLPPAVETKKPA